MGVIFYWSSQPSIPSPSTLVSKLAHVAEYSMLAGLLAFAFAGSTRSAMRAWVVATLYGVSDEVHQGFTPGRHPMVQDIVLDSAAAALCLQVLRFLAARRAVSRGRSATERSAASGQSGGVEPDGGAPLSSAHSERV